MSTMKWCLCSPASELLHTLSFSWLISRDLFVPADWKDILHTFHLPDLFDSVPDKHGRRGAPARNVTSLAWRFHCTSVRENTITAFECNFHLVGSYFHFGTCMQDENEKILKGIWKSVHPLADSSKYILKDGLVLRVTVGEKLYLLTHPAYS